MCQAAVLICKTALETYRCKGQEYSVEAIEYSECPNCREEIITADQIKRNEARIRDAKRKLNGLLIGAEIAEIRRLLGISQSEAAAIFGGGPNAFSKYERGEVVQSLAMDRLLRLAASIPECFSKLIELSLLPPPQKQELHKHMHVCHISDSVSYTPAVYLVMDTNVQYASHG
ncbi:MAG: type II toxin-antitoxin system MqsA family antitoxin [Gammaproteobacteria bacterium]|nr:type II toxin-antitoxin system MqsA family antitoxin [Gammaproteobacteria bacterium]